MNVEWISGLPAPVRRAGYFGLQALIGSRIGPAWREFRAWTRFSPAQLEQAVEQRLGEVLEAAVQRVPLYRSLGLRWSAPETTRTFLRQFPVLTRETVRERFVDLIVEERRGEIRGPESVARRRYDWLVVKTGGTTGVPTSVVHDARGRDWGRATRLFSAQLCGFPLGTRYFRLWGSEQELLEQEEKLDRRVLRNLLGEIPMNAFRAREMDLRRHHQTLFQRPDVEHMMAYVDAAVSLAMFIEDKGLPRPQLKTIMACAGTVTTEWREILRRVFHAEVFDKYGSRECADIACECGRHDGLHIFSPNVFVEVVDDLGRPCGPGQTGRILVTLLNNPTFPLIRYEIGDLGVAGGQSPCGCGLAFPRLRSIQGRQDDVLITEDGTRLSPVFVRHFVGVALNRQLIREWQLEQEDHHRFVFRFVPRAQHGLTENLDQLRQAFCKALGQRAEVRCEQVAEIPPSPTGKARWILNRVLWRSTGWG